MMKHEVVGHANRFATPWMTATNSFARSCGREMGALLEAMTSSPESADGIRIEARVGFDVQQNPLGQQDTNFIHRIARTFLQKAYEAVDLVGVIPSKDYLRSFLICHSLFSHAVATRVGG